MGVVTGDSTTMGQVVVDLKILRNAPIPEVRSGEERAAVREAEQRLRKLDGLQVARALIEFVRVTGVAIKI